MARTVWKTVLKPVDVQEVEVPTGAEFLHVAEQHGEICAWYRCDPHADKIKRTLAIVGTGHGAPDADQGRYIGTAMMRGGALVLHVFEPRAPKKETGTT